MAEDNDMKRKGDNHPLRGQTQEDRLSGEIISTLDTIEEDYTRFKNTINELKSNLKSFMENTSSELGRVKQETERKAEKELVESKVEDVEEGVDQVDERLSEVMREVGFGEKIDPSNIPPVLLESIYQKILDEIIVELRDNLGTHEANLVIQQELENMRMRTSGSELFQYDGRDITIRNLISSIENNLISPKQIHSTFQELVQKLSEKIPNYRPRNFRAMVRAEGLEYVITKTTNLISKMDEIDSKISEIEKNVNTLNEGQKEKYSELTEKMNEIEVRLDEAVDEKFNQIDYRISGLEEKLEGMDIEEISRDLDELEEKNQNMVERFDEMSSEYEMRMSIMEQELSELKSQIDGRSKKSLNEEERFVYYAIPEDGSTSKKLEKKVGSEVEDVQSCLESLQEKNKIKVEKRGRWDVYVRLDRSEVNTEKDERDEETNEEDIREEKVGDKEEETEHEDEQVSDGFGEGEEKTIKDKDIGEKDEEGDVDSSEVSEVIFDKGLLEEMDKGEEVEEMDKGEEVEEMDKGEEVEESDLTEKELTVLDKIPEDGCTIHHLDKQFEDHDKSEIEEILEDLIEKNQVSITKRNRWTIYLKQKEVE